MPGVATETHPIQTGFVCSQFYGSGPHLRYFAATPPMHLHTRPLVLGSSEAGGGGGYGYDVTDNKTNELLPPAFNLKPVYTMNDIFHREDERLKTFDTWPLEWMDKFQLAQTGMFYTGEGDKVKCYFCEVEIGRWEREDQPVPEHLRWSPNCPLLRRRTTNNIPISGAALDAVLPPPSYDICGANDAHIEVRPNAYAEGTISGSPSVANSSVQVGGGCATAPPAINYFPEYPEYAIEAARVRSFSEWPRHMKQKPEQLAEAGFFYTGTGDRVKCFSCGGGLKDWDDCDEPWEQHALWLSRCRFLKLMKGQNYIDAIIAKQKAKESGGEEEPMPLAEGGAAEQAMDEMHEAHVENVSRAKPEQMQKSASIAIPTQLNCDVAAAADVAPMATSPVAARIYDKVIARSQQEETTSAALEKRNSHSSIPEEKLCKICYAGEYNTAFLPCGHVVACAKCASSVTKCPLCRKPFTDVMRVYFS